jgi:hypothetical protein
MCTTDAGHRRRRSELVVKYSITRSCNSTKRIPNSYIIYTQHDLWNVSKWNVRERSLWQEMDGEIYGSVVNIDTHTKGSHWVGLILDCRNLNRSHILRQRR